MGTLISLASLDSFPLEGEAFFVWGAASRTRRLLCARRVVARHEKCTPVGRGLAPAAPSLPLQGKVARPKAVTDEAFSPIRPVHEDL